MRGLVLLLLGYCYLRMSWAVDLGLGDAEKGATPRALSRKKGVIGTAFEEGIS